MATDQKKPLPVISDFNRPFWEYAGRHELRLQRCLDCGLPWAPNGPVCPHCFSEHYEWAHMSGRGKIASWVVFHKAYHPAFKDDLPYNVTLVELEEGPRLISTVVEASKEDLHMGMELQVVFEDIGGGLALPKFRPVARRA